MKRQIRRPNHLALHEKSLQCTINRMKLFCDCFEHLLPGWKQPELNNSTGQRDSISVISLDWRQFGVDGFGVDLDWIGFDRSG
jgi:hypothetical protein